MAPRLPVNVLASQIAAEYADFNPSHRGSRRAALEAHVADVIRLGLTPDQAPAPDAADPRMPSNVLSSWGAPLGYALDRGVSGSVGVAEATRRWAIQGRAEYTRVPGTSSRATKSTWMTETYTLADFVAHLRTVRVTEVRAAELGFPVKVLDGVATRSGFLCHTGSLVLEAEREPSSAIARLRRARGTIFGSYHEGADVTFRIPLFLLDHGGVVQLLDALPIDIQGEVVAQLLLRRCGVAAPVLEQPQYAHLHPEYLVGQIERAEVVLEAVRVVAAHSEAEPVADAVGERARQLLYHRLALLSSAVVSARR